MEAGISGRKDEGAFSVVLSKGGYEDKDNGETISYCGTRGVEGKITHNTKLMRTSYRLQTPIRVIRSSKSLNKVYAPTEGFRYDGLYIIKGEQVLDQETAHFRFDLERLPNQDEIRCRGTVGERPTRKEREVLKIDRERRGLSN